MLDPLSFVPTTVSPRLGSRRKFWKTVEQFTKEQHERNSQQFQSKSLNKFPSNISNLSPEKFANEQIKVHALACGSRWKDFIPKEYVAIYGAEYDQYQASNIHNIQEKYKIEKDVHRTFGLFTGSHAPHQLKLQYRLKKDTYYESLSRVLLAISNRISYCQGMNFLAALFLLTEDTDKDAFILLKYLLTQCSLSCFYDSKTSCLLEYLKVFEKKLRKHNKKIYNTFKSAGFAPVCYAVEWFTTCFIVSAPGDLSACVLDLMFAGCSDVLIRVGLAVISKIEDEILSLRPDDIYMNFKSLVMKLQPMDVIPLAMLINLEFDFNILEVMVRNMDLMNPNKEKVDTLRSFPVVLDSVVVEHKSADHLSNSQEDEQGEEEGGDKEVSTTVHNVDHRSPQPVSNRSPEDSLKAIDEPLPSLFEDEQNESNANESVDNNLPEHVHEHEVDNDRDRDQSFDVEDEDGEEDQQEASQKAKTSGSANVPNSKLGYLNPLHALYLMPKLLSAAAISPAKTSAQKPLHLHVHEGEDNLIHVVMPAIRKHSLMLKQRERPLIPHIFLQVQMKAMMDCLEESGNGSHLGYDLYLQSHLNVVPDRDNFKHNKKINNSLKVADSSGDIAKGIGSLVGSLFRWNDSSNGKSNVHSNALHGTGDMRTVGTFNSVYEHSQISRTIVNGPSPTRSIHDDLGSTTPLLPLGSKHDAMVKKKQDDVNRLAEYHHTWTLIYGDNIPPCSNRKYLTLNLKEKLKAKYEFYDELKEQRQLMLKDRWYHGMGTPKPKVKQKFSISKKKIKKSCLVIISELENNNNNNCENCEINILADVNLNSPSFKTNAGGPIDGTTNTAAGSSSSSSLSSSTWGFKFLSPIFSKASSLNIFSSSSKATAAAAANTAAGANSSKIGKVANNILDYSYSSASDFSCGSEMGYEGVYELDDWNDKKLKPDGDDYFAVAAAATAAGITCPGEEKDIVGEAEGEIIVMVSGDTSLSSPPIPWLTYHFKDRKRILIRSKKRLKAVSRKRRYE